MKIAIFSDTYNPQVNGVVTVISILKKGLEKKGHTVYIYTVSHPEAIPEEDEKGKVYRVKSIKFYKEPQHRLAFPPNPTILKKIKDDGVEIIHSHSPFFMGHAAIAVAKFLKLPILHTFHTYFQEYLHYLGPLKIFVTDSILRLTIKNFCNFHNAIIAPSEKIKRVLENAKVKKTIELIPNGIDLKLFDKPISESEKEKFRKKFGIKKDEKIIIFVGRMAPEKSVDKVLLNFKKVVETTKQVKLLLVGDGPNKKDYEKLAKELGIRKYAIFTGYLKWPEEVAIAYSISHIFISASHTEVHPVTFIEAAASGLPIVAYNDLSIKGVVEDKENGFIFDNKDELYKGVIELLNNEDLRKKMGVFSKKISKNFSSDIFVDRMEELYHFYITKKFLDSMHHKRKFYL